MNIIVLYSDKQAAMHRFERKGELITIECETSRFTIQITAQEAVATEMLIEKVTTLQESCVQVLDRKLPHSFQFKPGRVDFEMAMGRKNYLMLITELRKVKKLILEQKGDSSCSRQIKASHNVFSKNIDELPDAQNSRSNPVSCSRNEVFCSKMSETEIISAAEPTKGAQVAELKTGTIEVGTDAEPLASLQENIVSTIPEHTNVCVQAYSPEMRETGTGDDRLQELPSAAIFLPVANNEFKSSIIVDKLAKSGLLMCRFTGFYEPQGVSYDVRKKLALEIEDQIARDAIDCFMTTLTVAVLGG